jgi:molybdopterin converting factor small subunit
VEVTVRYFAGARAAAGVAEEGVELAEPSGAAPTIADLVEALGGRHGPDLARVLTACTFLLDEVAGGPHRPLREGAQVDVLPPFAGG